jgi:hypothetical protein
MQNVENKLARYGMWMLYNVQFDGKNQSVDLIVEGKKQTLTFTNYENASKLDYPFNKWITECIPLPHGIDPIYTNCIFVFTENPNQHSRPWNFLNLIKLCLQLVYCRPSVVSNPFEWIDEHPSTGSTWNKIKSSTPVSKNCIKKDSLDLLVYYYNVLSQSEKLNYNSLQEIIQISEINDVLYETMLLWAFIEGYWNENGIKSDLTTSFLNMLRKDFAPGKSKKAPEIKSVTSKISYQNQVISKKKEGYGGLRNIVAHGWFLAMEKQWNKSQWIAVTQQRNLLLNLVTKSLVNRIKREYG